MERYARWADQFPYGSEHSSEIYEWIAQHFGRIALIEAIYQTPSGRACLRLPEEWAGRWPRGQVWGLAPNRRFIWSLPGPAWVLARLIAERTVDLVLTINWDSLVEAYARPLGVYLVTPQNNDTPSPPEDLVTLRVVETREDYYRPWTHESEIIKYNGGAFTSRRVLTHADEDPSRRAEWERMARRALVVSSTDLGSWRGETWAEDLVKEALRHHKVLVLGVSGNDNVFYTTVKDIQIEELRVAERRIARGDPYEPQIRFFVLGYRESNGARLVELFTYPYSEVLHRRNIRLTSAFLFQESDRFPRWQSGVWSLMHQLYARLLVRSAHETNRVHPEVISGLLARLDEEARNMAHLSVEEYWTLQGNNWLTLALNVMIPFWAFLGLPHRRAALLRVVDDYRAALPYVPFFQEGSFMDSMLTWIHRMAQTYTIQAFPAPGLYLADRQVIAVPSFRRADSQGLVRSVHAWSETFGIPLPPVETIDPG